MIGTVVDYLQPKDTDETDEHTFEQMLLVYEVDIRMVDDNDLHSAEYSKRFHGSEIYKTFTATTNAYTFKHILLDVQSILLSSVPLP